MFMSGRIKFTIKGLICVFWLLKGAGLHAQSFPFLSPRQTGLAGMAAPLPDGIAPLLAPAALGKMEVPEVGLAAGRLFGNLGLPVIAAGAAAPLSAGSRAGLGVVRLGTGNLTQTWAVAAYGYTLDKTCLALQVGYYQLVLGDAPTTGVPTFTLAGQSNLIPKVTLAGQVSNLAQPKLSTTTDERLPASFRASVMYEASDDLWLLVQTDKTLNRSAGFTAGLEYRLHRYLRLWGGAAPWPGLIGAGVRLDVWGMVLEYGVAHHGLLGQVHSIGIGWSLVQKNQPEFKTGALAQ
jgi:hypothetical protein